MPAGRPSIWSEELEQKALAYLTDYEQYGDVFPSVVGMAVAINVAKSTLYHWADNGKGSFSDILAKCNEASERVLITKGLTGDFNSNITKLVLGKHGYKEQKEVDQQVNLTAEHYLENLPPPDDTPSD